MKPGTDTLIDVAISKARKLPCFDDPSEIELLGGGITNINLCVTNKGGRFVVRFGSDIPEHGVMRWNELVICRAAEAAGVSPAVHYHEPDVLVSEYVKAKTFDAADVRDANNLPRIIDLMKAAHRGLAAHVDAPVLAFWPFQVNRSYISRLRADVSGYVARLPSMEADLAALETATGPVTLVIGHNDFLAANILDDGTRLWLIDWEYGGFNTPLFDLAGLAGNNGLSEDQERAVLEQYFETSPEVHWRPFQAMKCVSLMREVLWSMTSEIHSQLKFDYAAYTAENIDRLAAAIGDFHNS